MADVHDKKPEALTCQGSGARTQGRKSVFGNFYALI
jgi:hypothetical protein